MNNKREMVKLGIKIGKLNYLKKLIQKTKNSYIKQEVALFNKYDVKSMHCGSYKLFLRKAHKTDRFSSTKLKKLEPETWKDPKFHRISKTRGTVTVKKLGK